MSDINSLFYPGSVAIVGASLRPGARGNVYFLSPLLGFGFKGRIYPVNPHLSSVMGLTCYPNLKAIPGPVDQVMCAVPRDQVAQVVRESVEIGAKVVTICDLVEIARRGGVRLGGPNCIGLHCPEAGIALDGSIPRDSGVISCLSQSGGNALDFVRTTAERRMFLRQAVSFGNAADLNESDFLEHFARDEGTKIITIYIEGVKEPLRFREALHAAAARKPVVLLKGGSGQAGVRAASSHTGSLAGSRVTWSSLCREAGAIHVKNLEELIDTTMCLHYMPRPRGRRLCIVNMGGGASVLAADDCEDAGLEIPPLPHELQQEILKFSPDVGIGLGNPIDSAGEVYVEPALLARMIETVRRWDGMDILFVCLPTAVGELISMDLYRQQIATVVEARSKLGRPLVIILRTGGLGLGEKVVYEVQNECFKAGLPVFRSFGAAAAAVGRVVSYYEGREPPPPSFL
ncbi:MAG: CoA-binding protein [Chloroflexi bacterium]|nr:CoA-binding protein [Chloroflexota bacterium]